MENKKGMMMITPLHLTKTYYVNLEKLAGERGKILIFKKYINIMPFLPIKQTIPVKLIYSFPPFDIVVMVW